MPHHPQQGHSPGHSAPYAFSFNFCASPSEEWFDQSVLYNAAWDSEEAAHSKHTHLRPILRVDILSSTLYRYQHQPDRPRFRPPAPASSAEPPAAGHPGAEDASQPARPVLIDLTRRDEESEGEAETRTRFRAVAVFDVSQTDGEALPDFSVTTLVSEDGTELYEALQDIALARGLTITHTSPKEDSTANGTYLPSKQTIYIKEQARLQMTKTLAHELAHALHPQLACSTTAAVETVAEGVVYLTLAHFGLDSSEYTFRYIAGWNAAEDGRATLMRCMERIQKIPHTLIEAAAEKLDPATIGQEHGPVGQIPRACHERCTISECCQCALWRDGDLAGQAQWHEAAGPDPRAGNHRAAHVVLSRFG